MYHIVVAYIYFPIPSTASLFGPLEVDEILATVRHDITAVETNLEEPTVGTQPAARRAGPGGCFFAE